MRQLFEKCPACDGTRATAADMRTGRAVPVERCPVCYGARRVTVFGANNADTFSYDPCPRCKDVPAGGLVYEVIPAGSVCPCCQDGYCAIGMDTRQLEVMHAERDKLLDFADRVATNGPLDGVQHLIREAAALVPNLSCRAAEYRLRRPATSPPSPPPTPAVPPG